MANTFLAKLSNFITTVFDKIAVSSTRQALISVDDRTLADIGYRRQQVLNGDFFNISFRFKNSDISTQSTSIFR